ncbi:MAG: flagellar protein [Proteobacteria bacterium SG_bin9]|nr:MAG: flagellar protein [Proteobacteria bacterium SG_bin9]
MSDIVLTASVRQNLLSLQSTADLLATTQNRLATGKKVNTALDNPTNFFTAASLDSRAADINNLLDGIGNGVQVLQAANTGITSLQKLIDSAKSVANQALQTTVGYSPRSTLTATAIPGANASNLLGSPTPYTNATFVGTNRLNDNTSGATAITLATGLAGVAGAGTNHLATNLTAADTLTVNGITINFNSGGGTTGSATAGTLDIDVTTATVATVLTAIDAITGTATPSGVNGTGGLTLSTGTTSDLSITGSGNALTALGLVGGVTQARGGGVPPLTGQTLTITATPTLGVATNIVFGTGPGQVDTLAELNTALAANFLQATISSAGVLTITTTSDAASSTIGTVGGTLAGVGQPFNGATATAPVVDPAVQTTRANLVTQYNNIINQITTTAQDSSFNGINLLNADTLKLVFNETGTSTLNIQGVNFNPAGLGLSTLAAGTDFIDNNATNGVLTALNLASTSLRSQASSLGSNLSIVQIRQDFSKKLINVLQTGSSNLTLADTNEEAANSQALATRQSIAVSALALANQSQQSVLQLLQQ